MPLGNSTSSWWHIGDHEQVKDTSNYPDHVPILNVPYRNALRGCFVPISTVSELPEILTMFIAMGLCITDDTASHIEEIVDKKELRGTNYASQIYMGVNHDDVFMVSTSSYVADMAGLDLLDYQNIRSDRFSNHIRNSVYQAQTEGLAKELCKAMKKHGYRQEDGNHWIDDEGNFPYPYGEDTVYCPMNGKVMSLQESQDHFYQLVYSHYILYSMINETFFKRRIPEGGLDYTQLVRGKAYLRRKTTREPNYERDLIVYIDKPLDRYQSAVDRYGDWSSGSFNVSDNEPTDYYELITRSHPCYAKYRRAKQKWEEYSVQIRRQERENYMSRRKEWLYNKRNNIDTYNRDVETQLLSQSLHKMLTKALDNKVAQCLLKLNKVGYLDGSLRNITIRRSDKEMTYMPSGKPTMMTEDGNWVSKGRQKGKYGKIIRKVLNEQVPLLKFNDHDIEKLVNHLKAEASDGDFEIVKGEDIRHWYDGRQYHYDEGIIGTLASSCMRDESCGGFLDIYTENPNKVKMVILTKDDMLIGRAIVWDNKWMDRIYGTDSTITAFKTFAKEKGYHCKSSQNSEPTQGWIHPETGAKYKEDVIINLKTDFCEYPYADTLCYIDRSNGRVSNNGCAINSDGRMRDTGGGLEDDENQVYDEYDDRYIHRDDAVYVECRGYETHVENAFQCEEDDNWYLHPRAVTTWDDRQVYEGNADYSDGDRAYYIAGRDAHYDCDVEGRTYIEDVTPSVEIEELSMTVAQGNEDRAYEDAGYTFQDGSWILPSED